MAAPPKQPGSDGPKPPTGGSRPETDHWPTSGAPLDTAPYMPTLTPQDIPPHRPARDQTQGIDGFGPGDGTGHRDQLTGLSVADEIRLLGENNIQLSTRTYLDDDSGLGAMAAYVVSRQLTAADPLGVRFSKLELRTPDTQRRDSVGFSYAEFESNLQRQSVVQSSLGFGIPRIFKVNSSYSDSSAISTHEQKTTIHFQASQLIPKAKVVFDDTDISLDPRLVAKIAAACDARNPDQVKADRLLGHLMDYGHFVPLSLMLGGRISLMTSRELNDRSEFESVKRQLKAAADARFSADGVPVEAGGGGGVGISTTSSTPMSAQAAGLLMELKGGNEDLASSKAGTLGTKWIASMGPYLGRRTIGFNENSFVPIIDYLEPALRETCAQILRQHFLRNLDRRQSDIAGRRHGQAFELDVSQVKRFTRIVVNHEGHLDGLRLSFETHGGRHETVTFKGTAADFEKQHKKNTVIELKDGEEITAIETWVDPKYDGGVLNALAIVTNRRRFPDHEFYGTHRGSQFKVIRVPRVRGFFGFTGRWMHCIGLSYLSLAANTKSREYMLAMEPYLFPDGNYGSVS